MALTESGGPSGECVSADVTPVGNKARWVVVLSTARSGSTLLSVILGAHSHVIAPPELHVLRYRNYDEWRKEYPKAIRSLCVLLKELGQDTDLDAVEKRFRGRDGVDIYRELAALGNVGQLLVDKSPSYGRMGHDIQRLEEIQPFYIWLIRHPIAVMQSRIDRQKTLLCESRKKFSAFEYFWQTFKYRVLTLMGVTVRNQLAYWKEIHSNFERYLSGIESERKCIVHFEDLVRNPDVVINELCGRLHLDVEPAMFDPVNVASDKLEWGLGDEKIHSHKKINPEVADDWRQHCDVSVLDQEIIDLMRRIGVEQ